MHSPDSPPVIEVAGLVKHYGKVVAVDGIAFSVPAGRRWPARRQWRRQDDDPLHAAGPAAAHRRRIRVLGEDMLRHRHRVLPRMNFSSPYVDLPHRLTVRENLTVYAISTASPTGAGGSRRWPRISTSPRC